jgi:hypothetical protein
VFQRRSELGNIREIQLPQMGSRLRGGGTKGGLQRSAASTPHMRVSCVPTFALHLSNRM